MAARYSKVERRVWRDARVQRLTRSRPNGREFWLYLLTCDSQDAFPGLYVLRPSVAADDLGWERDDVLRMLDEVVMVGLAQYDRETNVVWLPNAPRKRVDEIRGNTRNAKGWRNAWDEMPECELTRAAFSAAIEALAEAADGDRNAPTVVTFSARPPRWLTAPQPDGSQDRSQDPSNITGSDSSRAHGSNQDNDNDKQKEKDKEQDRAHTHAREAPVDPSGVASELRRRLDLFPGMNGDDLARWGTDLRKDPDLHLPGDVSLVPYLRRALSALSDLVTATPTKPNKDRLAYVKRTAFGLVNDDRGSRWASGRTDGREGVCAPRTSQRAAEGPGTGGDDFLEHEAAEMERTLRENDRYRRGQTAPDAAPRGGVSPLGDLVKAPKPAA